MRINRAKRQWTPNPSATPAAFLEFFAGEWQRRLEAVRIPDMRDASWDRKAAWLLWQKERGPSRGPSLR